MLTPIFYDTFSAVLGIGLAFLLCLAIGYGGALLVNLGGMLGDHVGRVLSQRRGATH